MRKTQRVTRGFSLVEVVLALGVAAFCLLAIFGLLPVGINSNRTSVEQTAAANLALMVMADLQATPKGFDSNPKVVSLRYNVPAPPRPGSGTASHTLYLQEDGTATVAPDANAGGVGNPRYRVTVYYVPPTNAALLNPADNNNSLLVPISVFARVLITWPALADPTAASTPTNFSGSFESSSSLPRN